MAEDERANGNGFDGDRRNRITQAVMVRLRTRTKKADPQRAATIVADLEKTTVLNRRRPGQKRYSHFPAGVCLKALALSKAVAKAEPRSLLELMMLRQPGGDWKSDFEADTWSKFAFVLASLAAAAPAAKRPPNARLWFLEQKVLGILKAHGLLAKANQEIADILAECKADAGYSYPRDPRARVAALRRAMEKPVPQP